MKALTFCGKEAIQLADVPKPTLLLPTDVIVRVTLCGICGRCEQCVVLTMQQQLLRSSTTDAQLSLPACLSSCSDLHPYHEREKGLLPGTIVGHEFTGVVEECGSQVGVVPDSVTAFLRPFFLFLSSFCPLSILLGL